MREVTLPIEAGTTALDFESFFRAEYRSLCQALVLLVGDAFRGGGDRPGDDDEGARAVGPRRTAVPAPMVLQRDDSDSYHGLAVQDGSLVRLYLLDLPAGSS
jgi:hypothetical protein